MGEAIADKKLIEVAVNEISNITGQKAFNYFQEGYFKF